MKIDFEQQILNLKGEPIGLLLGLTKEGLTVYSTEEFETLGSICQNALVNDKDSKSDSTPEKLRKFNLALKIAGAAEIDDAELETLKNAVDKLHGPLVVGRVHELLKEG